MPIAYETVKLIIQLKATTRIKLQWIPSHEGVKANEIVDRLAGQASLDGIVSPLKKYPGEMSYQLKYQVFLVTFGTQWDMVQDLPGKCKDIT